VGAKSAVLMSNPCFWTQLSCGNLAFVKDLALHIASQICKHDPLFCRLDADGAGEQPHMRLFAAQ
jgi:hypothetical protein